MSLKLRGISPVIATVIILAVTIAIAVAVIGWITGLFGATTGGTEQLQIMPDSNITITATGVTKLYLHVVNKGSDVTIYKISVSSLGDADLANANVTGNIIKNGDGTITVKAGADGWIVATLPKQAVAGTSYTVKVYTKNGNEFTGTVTAQQAS